jgi:hypothetical protein
MRSLDLCRIADPHLETQQLSPPSHSHVDSSQLQISIELLGFFIAVVQSSFAMLASLFNKKKQPIESLGWSPVLK